MNEIINQREQLMHDIETILDGNFYECPESDKQDVIRKLCDAVVTNFPINNNKNEDIYMQSNNFNKS